MSQRIHNKDEPDSQEKIRTSTEELQVVNWRNEHEISNEVQHQFVEPMAVPKKLPKQHDSFLLIMLEVQWILKRRMKQINEHAAQQK